MRHTALSIIGFFLFAAPAMAQERFVASNAFNTCMVDLYKSEDDHFMIDLAGVVVCGVPHHPVQTSCSRLSYLTLSGRTECAAQDKAYWGAQHDFIVADFDVAPGGMVASGLGRCATEKREGPERDKCEAEVFWRDVIGFNAAQSLRAAGLIEALQ